MANSVDFRADQVQVNKVIVTGSNAGSQNALLVYGLDNQTSPLNQGYIDQAKFPTGSIGSDVFLYVSGGIGGRGVSGGAISVFGGDIHVSGNLTIDGTYPGGGGGGTPGGSIGQAQYNAGSGIFGAIPTLTYIGSQLVATGSFSGSFEGVLTSSYAVTASYALNVGSTVQDALTASLALSSIQWQDGGNKLATTSSIAFAGALGTGYFADNVDPAINLFVSGSAVIGGNLIVSGALETDTILGNTLQGSKITTDYIELVNVVDEPVPSVNGTYLYSSGSTNDLYIVHNNSALNKTNFRWVENSLGTGLLQGGILSTETGTTTFSVTAGEGIVLSYNATTSSVPDATIKKVDWSAFTSQSLTYISSDPQTFIGISDTGGLFQQTTPFSAEQYALYIPLGRILHVSGATTYGIANQPRVAYGQSSWNSEFARSFGPLKLSGHVLAASGSTLDIVKTGGSAYVEGKNYAVDPNSPNVVLPSSDGPVTVSKLFRQYVSGSDSTAIIIDTNGGSGFANIDPNNYNPSNAGTLTPVTPGRFTIQRVYWAPNSSTNAFWVYYGSGEYNSLTEAQAGIPTEIFQEGTNTIGATILVANILVASGATDLSNPAQAQFVQGGLFRGSGTGIGGAGGATVPGGLDTYVQFNDGGSTFGGDPGFTYNKIINTLSVENITATTVTASTDISSSGTLAVGGNTVLTTVTASNLNVTGTFTSTGPVVASGGLSGSLQKLADGSSYLVAGPNITVNTASSGQVSITGSIGGSNTQLQYNNNGVFGGVSTLTYNGTTLQGTGSFSGSYQGNLTGTASYATNAGLLNGLSDTAYAKLGSTNTFTGNNVFTNGFSGSIQKLSDGVTNYLAAGPNITINTASNGQVRITGSIGGTNTQIQYNNNGLFGGVPTLTYNGTTLQASGAFSGSFQGNLTGTASYASNAGLLNNLADTAFAKLASANTFTQTNAFAAVTATSVSSSGNVSAQGNLFVQGNSQFTGSAFFAGNVTLGNTTADIVTVNAQMTASNLRATGSFSGSFTGTFPATVPTVTTNTWAPTLTFAGGGGTSQTKVGTYVKIGQLVIANFSITRTTGTAGSGTVTLTALPFTSQTTTGVAGSIVVSNFQNVVSGPRVISGVVTSNATTATMYFMDTGAADMSLLTGAELTSTTILQGTITYIAAS